LEEELSVEDVDIRVLATGVLGEMFGEKGHTLAKRYEATWAAWKGRRADAAAAVRVEWVERAAALYQQQPQLARELNADVAAKLSDVDERVRVAACRALGQLEMGAAVQGALGDDVVAALGERCKDRRAAVRAEAIVALATLYSQVVGELEQSAAARHKWGGIPSTIFVLRYVNDPDIDSKVESIMTGAILNFAKIRDDREKCRRLLLVFDSLTPKAQNGFFSYMRRQRDVIRMADAFLALCERSGEDAGAEQQQRALAVKLSACFPDRVKLEGALTQLAGLQDSDVYAGLRQTMDARSDIKTVRKCQKSALKRLASLAPNLLDTTAPLWKCAGLTTINRVLVPYLIESASASRQGAFHGAAATLLAYTADVFPEMLELCKDELFAVEGLQAREPGAVEERLKLMVRFAKAVPNSVPRSTELENRLAALVRSGTVAQAKRAAFVVTQMPGAAALCAALTGDVVDGLDDAKLERHAPAFAALSRLALHAPAAYATYADRISQFLVQKALTDADADMDTDAGDAEWVGRGLLGDAGLARVYAVKILAHWLAGMDRAAVTRDVVQTVLGTLRQLVRGSGSGSGGVAGRSAVTQHCVLAAAASMVKLAGNAHVERAVGVADVQSLALVVQDASFEVRSAFLLDKLVPALAARRVHARFMPLVFLAAHEVEPGVRDHVRHAVEQRLAQFRPTPGSPSLVESSLVRLLHILAHHPDWDDAEMRRTLDLFAPYVDFYIACVCGAQNVSLLFCYAGELKAARSRPQSDGAVRGVTNEQYTTRLYVLSELAQYLLREKSQAANWPVNVYPGQLRLPEDLFEMLGESERAVAAKPFLDPEFVAARGKPAGTGAKRTRQKPKPAPKPSKKSRGKRAQADSDSDAMDEDSESSDEE
ncbi:Sister chromatid cohesion protein pds5, partial [Coemansia erecta]